uniref:Uncharacterized protein n=1 Tax=Arundo donax TaxID=35708 RepID=A0A0A9DUQ9_ARUDO
MDTISFAGKDLQSYVHNFIRIRQLDAPRAPRKSLPGHAAFPGHRFPSPEDQITAWPSCLAPGPQPKKL